MSDPMTNTEVEDVLASIRRLVSDDNRPDLQTNSHKVVVDRLVLTPSLRVMDDKNVAAPEAADVPAETELPDTPDHEESATQADVRHADDPALEEIVQPVLAQDGIVQDMAVSSEPLVLEDDANIQEDSFANDVHDNARNTVIGAPVQSSAEQQDLETNADTPGPDMSDGASVSHGVPDANADLDAWPVAEDLGDITAPQHEVADEALFVLDENVDQTAGFDDRTATTTAQSLSEKVAALETLVGKRGDNFEPDDLNVGANAGTEPPAMAWEDAEISIDDAAEYADTATEEVAPFDDTVEDGAPAYAAFIGAQSGSEPEPEDAAAQLFSSEEDVLDEEALRELVSDIVREELQGALGERITRNVRKLVRREIHRALAAQDLE